MPARRLAGPGIIALGVVLTLARAPKAADDSSSPRAVVDKYCLSCHSTRVRTAGLDLERLDLSTPGADAETWEKIIAKLRAGSMPPPGRPRPDNATYRDVATKLEREVDRVWATHPDPGRMAAVHRLNRAEYNNAIRPAASRARRQATAARR